MYIKDNTVLYTPSQYAVMALDKVRAAEYHKLGQYCFGKNCTLVILFQRVLEGSLKSGMEGLYSGRLVKAIPHILRWLIKEALLRQFLLGHNASLGDF